MSAGFRLVCLLHSGIAVVYGVLIMLHLDRTSSRVLLGVEIRPKKILGSTPQDQLLIHSRDSLVGLCFFVIGLLLFVVSYARDAGFHSLFAKGCVVVYTLMAAWRVCYQRKFADFNQEWLQQVIGDVLLAVSWIFFLFWSWREKFD